jgi:hypothetical protein
VKRATLALFFACTAVSAYSQTSASTDADRKLARSLSSSIVYLKTMTEQCAMGQSEKDTLALFAKVSVANAFGKNKADKPSVDAGAREGRSMAISELARGPRGTVCEKARKTIQQIGTKMNEFGVED